MTLADKLGFGPKREHVELPDGSWRVSVTPPAVLKLPTQSIVLTQGQFIRYMNWRNGSGMLADQLPDLNNDQREVLQSGIGTRDWNRMFPPQADER